MILGSVNAALEPIVRLRVRGLLGGESDVDALVDTGFSGTLTLPPATVASLGLRPMWTGTLRLADGSTRVYPVYAVEVEWNGAWRLVEAAGFQGEALVGAKLLDGHELTICYAEGGAVTIASAP